MAAGGHFGWTTMSIIELDRDIWMSNACAKFEDPSKVIALTTKLWRGGRGRGGGGGCVADENIIFPETYVSREYNYKLELVYLPKGKYCVYPRMVYRPL